jgi:hypothetical protein
VINRVVAFLQIGSIVVMAPEVQVNRSIICGTAKDVVVSCSCSMQFVTGNLFSLRPPVPVKHITVKQVNQLNTRQCNRIANNRQLETASILK